MFNDQKINTERTKGETINEMNGDPRLDSGRYPFDLKRMLESFDEDL